MTFAGIEDATLHYVDEGPRDAPAIAFTHALGMDLRIWDDVAAMLGEEFRLIRFDMRGHGLSSDAPGRFDIEDFAADLAALLARVGAPRATVVGLSIGGLVAQALTRARPDLVAALVLAGTAAKLGTAESWDARIAAVERGGVAAIADPVLRGWFTEAFHAGRPDDLKGWRAMLTRTPQAGYIAACNALKRADFRPLVGSIDVPTLCLVGDQDGSTPVALVRETAASIPGARFEVIAGAGHLANIEQPAEMARLIADAARRTDSAA